MHSVGFALWVELLVGVLPFFGVNRIAEHAALFVCTPGFRFVVVIAEIGLSFRLVELNVWVPEQSPAKHTYMRLYP